MASGETQGHDRTEQPTARRRQEARRKGQIAKSPDLTAALLLLGSLGMFNFIGGQFFAGTVAYLHDALTAAPARELTVGGALGLFQASALAALRLAWPLVVIPGLIAVASQLFQTRLAVPEDALGPKWDRIDPRQGIKRLLSSRGAVELLKSALKLALVGGAVVVTLRGDWPIILTLGQTGTEPMLAALGRIIWDVWLGVGMAYLLLASVDYGFQWWQLEKSLRMTKQEVREETRETEGDPAVRGRIRALQRKLATNRMMAEVKRADAVIRNPTHFAVAVRYESGKMGAPRVVAKGERLVALRIIDLAGRHGVPVVENPPLARALFAAVAVGREIPRELYQAVAEVLAYVYALRRGGR